MNIITINKDLIPQTSKFSKDIFIDYYTNLIGYDQSLYMANKFLSEEAINNLINNGAIFRLVYENNVPIAFTEYIKEEKRVFLSKLYVSKTFRGKGIGRYMFEDCIKYTLNNNLNKIYLTVNKYNYPSLDIYKHLGFIQIDAVVNDIGNGYVMDDYIMEYTI